MSEKTNVVATQYKKKNQLADVWRRLKKNKTAVLGLTIFLLMATIAIVSPLIYDYKTDVIKLNYQEKLMAPSAKHIFGTDEMGRDMLARVIWGGRMSLSLGFITVAFALSIGGTLGAIAGYFGGALDNVIMRIMDIFLAIPNILFAICIVAALGPSTINLVIAMAVSSCPTYARVVRGPVLTVREVEYIEAARAIGANSGTIIISHVIPNCMAPIIVQTTLNVASTILSIAGLSFLGLGIQPPTPEWGSMLSSARNYIRDYSYMAFFPGIAIMITILSLNLFGDGLRDALDPRLK